MFHDHVIELVISCDPTPPVVPPQVRYDWNLLAPTHPSPTETKRRYDWRPNGCVWFSIVEGVMEQQSRCGRSELHLCNPYLAFHSLLASHDSWPGMGHR